MLDSYETMQLTLWNSTTWHGPNDYTNFNIPVFVQLAYCMTCDGIYITDFKINQMYHGELRNK